MRVAASPPHGGAEPLDPAILRIVRALARQAAREDHARETGQPIPGLEGD
jgi:hypothetical protein